MASFPAPVGGTPLPLDFVPSIIAAVHYASLLPLVVYRLTQRRSRTMMLIGCSIFSLERTVFFTLRAVAARKESLRFNPAFTFYAQTSLAMGFIGIAMDTASLLRCVLVNPTFGSAMYYQSPSAATEDCLLGPPPPETPDQPLERRRVRILFGLLSFEFLMAIFAALVTHFTYGKSLTNMYKAETVALFRFTSTALVLTVATVLFAYSLRNMRRGRISSTGLSICSILSILVIIVATYRLFVLQNRVDSLTSPSSLNSKRAKYVFYLLHVLPEWLAVIIIIACKTCQIFGTGFWGDWRWVDDKKGQDMQVELTEAQPRQEGQANDSIQEDAEAQTKNASSITLSG